MKCPWSVLLFVVPSNTLEVSMRLFKLVVTILQTLVAASICAVLIKVVVFPPPLPTTLLFVDTKIFPSEEDGIELLLSV